MHACTYVHAMLMDLFCLEGHDEVNITIEIKPDSAPEVAEVFTVNLVNVSDLDRLQIGAVSIVIFWLVSPYLLASYADILWAHHAIFLPHERLMKPFGTIPCPLFACIPLTVADFAPKIGWRSHKNFFTTN